MSLAGAELFVWLIWTIKAPYFETRFYTCPPIRREQLSLFINYFITNMEVGFQLPSPPHTPIFFGLSWPHPPLAPPSSWLNGRWSMFFYDCCWLLSWLWCHHTSRWWCKIKWHDDISMSLYVDDDIMCLHHRWSPAPSSKHVMWPGQRALKLWHYGAVLMSPLILVLRLLLMFLPWCLAAPPLLGVCSDAAAEYLIFRLVQDEKMFLYFCFRE